MTAVSLLDGQTARAIREALAAARRGRIADACDIGERALQAGGDPAALNAMLGTLRCRAGQAEQGIRHLRAAHDARPSDPVIALNLAAALAERGDYCGALDRLGVELARSDPTMRIERLRGFAAQMLEDFSVAIAAYERVIAAFPFDWQSWNNLGNARRLAGDLDGSVAALRRAAELNPGSAPVRLNFAAALNAAGQIEEGERQLRSMAEDFPRDTQPLVQLHLMFKELVREEDALDAIEAAAQRDPSNLELLLAVASHRLMMLLTEAAEAAYREVIARDPLNEVANLGLAVTFDLTNRTAELNALVREVEERGLGDDGLNFIRALDHRRQKRFAEGLAALTKVDDQLESVRRSHLMGQLHDGAGNFDDAFAAFSRMNGLQCESPTRPEQRAAGYRRTVRVRRETMTGEWMKSWRAESKCDVRPAPVFLVGFPRSGTTLLDTMLMGHPNIEVLEEEPALNAAENILSDFSELPTLDEELIRDAREAYFGTAAACVAMKPGSLLVDKNPLVMNSLPIIYRLFPGARIVLAVRHPVDAVLSCFITNFKLNEGMSSFLRLDTAAELYDLSFGCFERAQQLLGMPMHKVVYENVVTDRERELRSLLDFLTVGWSNQVLDHESTARQRGRIKTASYAQVGEAIYTRAAGRWQNYRKHLEPVLPILEPWVRKYGYEL